MWAPMRGAFLVLLALGLYSASAAASHDKAVVAVVGLGECADCARKNIESGLAFNGLRVAINCKNNKGEYKTSAVAALTKKGKFSVELPRNLIGADGTLKGECFAELRSASNVPCPSPNGIESSKIVLKSKDKIKVTLEKLVFSKDTCAAAFWWKYPWHKPIPKITLPPLHHFPISHHAHHYLTSRSHSHHFQSSHPSSRSHTHQSIASLLTTVGLLTPRPLNLKGWWHPPRPK
ncbi:hypothetical protein QJS10_CPA01g00423 [Acorus calamus]|uniref:Uncharacterized protein n=1 Tax=Acorus calamus TaxID=4465 RepID=A0AAV9FGI3_ACOCL|nr:hypothetical protein QJS10_CPA01g00423 [Acorus calamus]